MAANLYASGSGSKAVEFTRAVKHLNIFVSTGTTFSISFDGENYMTLPAGFSNFPVGPILELWVSANGEWQIWAVQS